jgi:hypothetical protein
MVLPSFRLRDLQQQDPSRSSRKRDGFGGSGNLDCEYSKSDVLIPLRRILQAQKGFNLKGFLAAGNTAPNPYILIIRPPLSVDLQHPSHSNHIHKSPRFPLSELPPELDTHFNHLDTISTSTINHNPGYNTT